VDAGDVNTQIRSLIDGWCDRREYHALACVLPAWVSNNGLTDGWTTLRDDLRRAHAVCRDLPATERDQLKALFVEIDRAVR